MENPVVGGYSPDRVALRRAIGLAIDIDQEIRLYWRGQAIPAQSACDAEHCRAMTRLSGQPSVSTTWRMRGRCWTRMATLIAMAMAGVNNRMVRLWCWSGPQHPTSVRASVTSCDVKDMNALGIRVNFNPAKWPENLKNARAGKRDDLESGVLRRRARWSAVLRWRSNES